MILGIDAGGTFTDLYRLDDAGQVRSHKLLTSARVDLSQSCSSAGAFAGEILVSLTVLL